MITVNGRPAKPAQRIRAGDVIVSHVPVRDPPPVEPEPIPLEVLHEDYQLVIVNKPPGLVMHPAPGHWTGTLLNALVITTSEARRREPERRDSSIASTRAPAASSSSPRRTPRIAISPASSTRTPSIACIWPWWRARSSEAA